jgi:shikimate kinase
MDKKGNIYLVGFMGTGKSSVGRELARRKKWHFLDLDELIEMREKRQIPDIFAEKGEAYFRRIEKKALQEISRQKNFVVACGGGIVMDPENIRAMRETGTAVCLKADLDTILKRTSGFLHRPLLNVEDPRSRIELLLKFRSPYYAKADFSVETSRIGVAEVVLRIIKLLSCRQRVKCQPPRKAKRKITGRKK